MSGSVYQDSMGKIMKIFAGLKVFCRPSLIYCEDYFKDLFLINSFLLIIFTTSDTTLGVLLLTTKMVTLDNLSPMKMVIFW